ncbi:hypothetical protein AM500_13770 [Bacillus sp. FJAT-18017]|uniref:hypothetical protein n=1 Tax=Bacillus sp. FJAT-18017 TaxID=1705566 RepID=UPI0006AF8323|nr:hypothetical protein [Bacillus sp. FJAT-18017]ALC90736.1 hypothetical protein AM500_13770 [Bacillus sp. FJAT-18017]
MLKYKFEEFLKENEAQALFKEEKEFAEKHAMVQAGLIAERDARDRFMNAYIERSNKETEQLIAEAGPELLEQPLTYLQENKNEFLYMESEWFELIGVDAVSLEMDDLFGHYSALVGLKLQKKYGEQLRKVLEEEFGFDKLDYGLMFDANEGIWNFNFSINKLNDFFENMTIGEAFSRIYRFLFQLIDKAENGKIG